MAGRVYNAVIDAVSVAAAKNVWTIRPPASKSVKLREIVLGSDHTGNYIPLRIIRGITSQATQGGTRSTPAPVVAWGPAAGSTVHRTDTSLATSGADLVFSSKWTTEDEFRHVFLDDQEVTVDKSGNLSVILAPTDAHVLGGTLVFEEVSRHT